MKRLAKVITQLRSPKKQEATLRFVGSFAQKSKFSLFLRNQIFRFTAIPWIVDAVAGRGMVDRIELPEYSRHG